MKSDRVLIFRYVGSVRDFRFLLKLMMYNRYYDEKVVEMNGNTRIV